MTTLLKDVPSGSASPQATWRMQKQQHLNQLANAVFIGRTPGTASVLGASAVQNNKIGIECYQHTLLCRGKRELIGVSLPATVCVALSECQCCAGAAFQQPAA
jgi:hypothetical protein